jgi:hypothetical protein
MGDMGSLDKSGHVSYDLNDPCSFIAYVFGHL